LNSEGTAPSRHSNRGVRAVAEAARQAARSVAKVGAEQRRTALDAVAAAIDARTDELLAANRADLAAVAELPAALRDRLMLDDARLAALARAVREIAAQPELVGRVERPERRPNGLVVERVRIPLGVIAMIYEARPNVTVDAAALCIKAGNACILRGGREADASNRALLGCIRAGLAAAELPADAVQLLPAGDRAAIAELVALDGLVDLCIPRGGEGLIRFVAEHARVPVIKHYRGVCHVFVHAAADLDTALRIVDNAKTSRPSACNACETVLVDRAIAGAFVPALVDRLAARVELRGDAEACRLGVARAATDADWGSEYLANILAVRVVDGIAAAIAHIERYGSDHTEAIVTTDDTAAERFVRELDSSTVIVNASTRFADGGELGLGAEIGISTTRLHAYGPMGAEGLTTTKFVVRGTGQIRGA
jgi:glutamate-5-semialdehyde dehydrogenase